MTSEADNQLLTFGTTFEIGAADAASVESLGMILTIDPGRQTLTLHSGNVKVSRVYFHTSQNMQAKKQFVMGLFINAPIC